MSSTCALSGRGEGEARRARRRGARRPAVQGHGPVRHEVGGGRDSAPGVAEAVVRLYRAYADRSAPPSSGARGRARARRPVVTATTGCATTSAASATTSPTSTSAARRCRPSSRARASAEEAASAAGAAATRTACACRCSAPSDGRRAAPLRPPPEAAVPVGAAGRVGAEPSPAPTSSRCSSRREADRRPRRPRGAAGPARAHAAAGVAGQLSRPPRC